MFSSAGNSAKANQSTWNNRWAGAPALNSPHKDHLAGRIFSKLYLAHRAAWAIQTGEWPEFEIDHIDHNGRNNKWENLREVTHAENAKNIKLPNHNTSGRIGVSWDSRGKQWESYITVNRKRKFLGYFSDFGDATDARLAAEIENGFHKNHGAMKYGRH